MISVRRLIFVSASNTHLKIGFIFLSFFVCFFVTKQWVTSGERPVISITQLSPEERLKRPPSELEYAYKYNLLDGVDDAFSQLAADHAECTLGTCHYVFVLEYITFNLACQNF